MFQHMRRRYIICFITFLTLISCQSNHNKHVISEDGLHVNDSVFEEALRDIQLPSAAFEDFTMYLDSIGFFNDTVLAQKTHQMQDSSFLILTNSKKFLKVKPSTHPILNAPNELEGNTRFDSLIVDFDVFKQAESIMIYQYKDKRNGNMKVDGEIEEWSFATVDKAQNALKELNKFKDMYYFNTKSYAFQNENYMYIFHARAAAFEIPLKQIYLEFKKRVSERKKDRSL